MYILQECDHFLAVKFKEFNFFSFSLFIQNENKIRQSLFDAFCFNFFEHFAQQGDTEQVCFPLW